MIGSAIANKLGGQARRGVDQQPIYHRLFEAMNRVVMIPPPEAPVPGKRDTYIRASGLGYMCARQEAFHAQLKAMVFSEEDASGRFAMSLGSAYHEMLQTELLPELISERMLGWWKMGQKTQQGFLSPGVPRLLPAPRTKAGNIDHRWKYNEVYAFNDDHLIRGHPDLVVDWTGSGIVSAPDGLEVQEYKTKSPLAWSRIDPAEGGFPDLAHVAQVQIYMWLLRVDHARIVYVKKGENDPSKMFVEWRVSARPDSLATLQETLAGIVKARQDPSVLPERICENKDVYKAKGCWCRAECFGLKAPRNERYKIRADETETATQ